jgi:hemoglobin-like flavoprotein
MTPAQIALVQSSFAAVKPIAPQAAALFYGQLFTLDPSLKALFKHNMEDQGAKLMATLGVVVAGLAKAETILPAVQELGKKHISYGVRAEHYPTVGAALLWTLEQGLGPAFTPEVKEAWTAAYGLLSSVMIKAAYG